MTTAQDVYQKNVESLSAGEQLRLASLILNGLQSVEFVAPALVAKTPQAPAADARPHQKPHVKTDAVPLDDMLE